MRRTKRTRIVAGALSASLLASGEASSRPVETVPWNGYPGAASFTFDDDCQSQLDNLVPALRSRKVKATFFLYDVGGAFTNNKAAWVAAAREGHELANHSVDHADFSKSIDATFQVSDMASRLRKADTSVQAVTFAYPGCAAGNESAVGAENIIGRTCLFAAPYQPLKWSSPPSNWNEVGAIYVSDDATATGPVLQALDAARNGGWISTLNHGVGGDWIPVATANVLGMVDRARSDSLWVATYQEVAAYWRAGSAMDQATAATTATGWTISWKSPHPRMPRSVPLRVRLDSSAFPAGSTVLQNGRILSPRSDGSYLVEFMELQMEVRKPATGIRRAGSTAADRYRWADGMFLLPGVESGSLSIVDSRGRIRSVGISGGSAFVGTLPAGLYRLRVAGDGPSAIQTVLVGAARPWREASTPSAQPRERTQGEAP